MNRSASGGFFRSGFGRFEKRGRRDAFERAANRPPRRVEMRVFKLGEDFLRPANHLRRDSGKPCDMNPVAAVGRTGDDFMQEGDFVVPFAHGNVEIIDPRTGFGQIGQLVIMRCEKGPATDSLMQRFGNRPREGNPVVGTRSAPDFVEHDQAFRRCAVENPRCFDHFDHERTQAAGQFIARTDAGKDPIDHADLRFRSREKGAGLRHDHQQRDLSNKGAFSRHIRAGNQVDHRVGAAAVGVIWDKGPGFLGPFEDRMTPLANMEYRLFDHRGARVMIFRGDLRQGTERVEHGERTGGALNFTPFGGDFLPQSDEKIVFERFGLFLRAENLLLVDFEFLGNIAFGVFERLLADIFRRNFIAVQARYLDIIAENGIKADFERRNSRARRFRGLIRRQPLLAAASEFTVFVEFGVITGSDKAAVTTA